MLARWRARTPLRTQLVLVVVLLAGIAVLVTGLVGAALLRQSLLARVDDQLVEVSSRLPRELDRVAGLPELEDDDDSPGMMPRGSGRWGMGPLGPGEHYVVQIYDQSGALVANVGAELTDDAPPDLPTLDAAGAAVVDGQPFSTSSDSGQWRVLVTAFPNATLVVGTPLGGLNRTVGQLLVIDAAVAVVLLGLLAGVALLVVRASLRPLTEVEHTAEAVAAGDLSRRVPVPHPATEVGSLATSLNSMMTRIEESFRAQTESEAQARTSEERMRRFVGDASHELRTPLTSVRGFAELYRQGAVPADELPRVMRRIEDEAARMGLLVEDLLLLARLDQQRPLARAPVDLAGLAADAVHDAAVTGPDHPTTLRVLPGRPPVVLGDEARLRQVLANLIVNAVTHTPPGTPVQVTVGTVDGDQALLEVADQGPGMSDDVAGRVFERFYRADESRARAHGSPGAPASGSGLGLSIVSALVAAHGGHVEVRTALGAGSTFRVLLPSPPPAVGRTHDHQAFPADAGAGSQAPARSASQAEAR